MTNKVPNAERKLPVSSYRLAGITKEQIDYLAERWGCSKADVINRAVDQAFNHQQMLDEKGATLSGGGG
jgi:hypothetical protein